MKIVFFDETADVQVLDGGVVEFTFSDSEWQRSFSNFFFCDIGKFARHCISRGKLPGKFLIRDIGEGDTVLTDDDCDHPLIKRVAYVSGWVELLEAMADYNKGMAFIFFAHQGEGKAKTYELKPFIEFSDLLELNIDFDSSIRDDLLSGWKLDDALRKDRRSIMQVSFGEVMGAKEAQESDFLYFLKSTQKLSDRYHENYEIHVNRFTVDKQLREIDEQRLNFVGKLQDLISGAQTKAFAMPGVMISFGMLAKVTNTIGILAIIAGIIMTHRLLSRSNELLVESLEYFKKTTERAFEHYVGDRGESREVRCLATEAKGELCEQIDKAIGRADSYKSMAWWMSGMACAICVILLIQLYMESIEEYAKLIQLWVYSYINQRFT